MTARVEAGTAPSMAPASAPAAVSPGRPRDHWRWLGLGAALGSAVTAGVAALVIGAAAWRADGDLADEAVAAHVRATLGGHAVEVASADGHTVKPWLSARLDYAAPVNEAPQDGFTLIGGRIDRLQRVPVAALVYRHRLHTIDVFVRPSSVSAAPTTTTVRGFSVARAGAGGMEWIAVSDVDPAKLSGLVRSLAGPAAGGGGAVSGAGR